MTTARRTRVRLLRDIPGDMAELRDADDVNDAGVATPPAPNVERGSTPRADAAGSGRRNGHPQGRPLEV